MEKKTFVKGAAILAVSGLVVKLIGLVYRIPLLNIVGSDGMHYYEIVYRYYSWLLVISSSGIPTAISKLVSERLTLGDYKGGRSVFKTAWWLLLFIGAATTAFMYFGSSMLASISYPADAADQIANQALAFKALAPSLLFVSLLCAYRGYLQGMQHMLGTGVSQIVEQAGKLAIGFTLAAKLAPQGPAYAVMGALIGISASELMGLAVIFCFYLRRKKMINYQTRRAQAQQKPLLTRTITKRFLRIALPVTIGASIMPLTGIIDSALIIRMLESTGFTVEAASKAYALLYSCVTPIINMPAVLTMALATSLVPAISSYMAKRELNQVRAAARTGMKLALIIGAPCSIGLFVLSKPILRMLFTSLTETELTITAGLMQISCVGVVFLSLVQTLTGIIQGLGRARVPVLNLVFGAVLKVVTLMALVRVPHINIQGAAVSTVVCYAAAGLMDVIYLINKTKMKARLWDVFIKPILASVLMGVTVHYVYEGLAGMNFGNVLVTLAALFAGVLVYGVLVILLKMLRPADLAFIPGGKFLEQNVFRYPAAPKNKKPRR
ncbi:MAG: polysaccharide biosynthesis protein [Clostridiales bacterium]|jgi:stage V sporulation protein B|nr:polysaccharide biosynthesis protein [Clostridiales bacterium]